MKIQTEEEKNFVNKPDFEQERLYLLHHMHHFKKGNDIDHELHHCFLYEGKNMTGKQYKLYHQIVGSELYHCIEPVAKTALFDHINNKFETKVLNIDGQNICIIEV